MKNVHGIVFGRAQEWIKTNIHPEEVHLWTMKAGMAWDAPYTFRKWNNAESLNKCLQLQGQRAPRNDDWKKVSASGFWLRLYPVNR